ncbi:MAG: hypothetical protein JWN56_2769 [Sphingobacteriales bacterium]|nr:hypothetical protein [Sphingobacteriales bacterium]
MRVLISGWFSFKDMGTTAGDLIARDIVCDWLKEAHIPYDVAIENCYAFQGGVEWEKTNPLYYTDLIFVCGPFGNGWPITEFLSFFSNCRLIGVNLSLLESLEQWNPFTFLHERDSSIRCHPDITFYSKLPKVPVVGIILAHKQLEYGKRAFHEQANAAIYQLLETREASIVPIDTAMDHNIEGLRTPAEVESLISKMDIVITTRLHGTVLSLKNAVPVIPIDPIAGGAKISLQVEVLNWPVLFNATLLDQNKLLEAFNYCLTPNAKIKAIECTAVAVTKIEAMKTNLLTQLLL